MGPRRRRPAAPTHRQERPTLEAPGRRQGRRSPLGTARGLGGGPRPRRGTRPAAEETQTFLAGPRRRRGHSAVGLRRCWSSAVAGMGPHRRAPGHLRLGSGQSGDPGRRLPHSRNSTPRRHHRGHARGRRRGGSTHRCPGRVHDPVHRGAAVPRLLPGGRPRRPRREQRVPLQLHGGIPG